MTEPSELPPDERALIDQLELEVAADHMTEPAQEAVSAGWMANAQEFRSWIKQSALITGGLEVSGVAFYEVGNLLPTQPGVLWAGKLMLMGYGLGALSISAITLTGGINDLRRYQAAMKQHQPE